MEDPVYQAVSTPPGIEPDPNNPPVAVDDAIAGNYNASVEIAVSTLLSNDTDLDNDTLVVVSVSNALNGSAVITGGGTTVTFTPTNGYWGSAAGFDYTISDGQGGTDVGHATVTIPNPPPIAVDDAFDGQRNTPVVMLMTDLLVNDSDPNGGTLSVTAVANPVNGSVAITGGGTSVTFTPTNGFVGTATFEYTLSDGQGGTDTGLVTLTISNALPTAVDDEATTPFNALLTIPFADLLLNDVDPDGGTLTITAVGGQVNGVVDFDTELEQVTFMPDTDFIGNASFTYTISDGQGGTDTATVTVHVQPPPNQEWWLVSFPDSIQTLATYEYVTSEELPWDTYVSGATTQQAYWGGGQNLYLVRRNVERVNAPTNNTITLNTLNTTTGLPVITWVPVPGSTTNWQPLLSQYNEADAIWTLMPTGSCLSWLGGILTIKDVGLTTIITFSNPDLLTYPSIAFEYEWI